MRWECVEVGKFVKQIVEEPDDFLDGNAYNHKR
jgi:hypothetical protein